MAPAQNDSEEPCLHYSTPPTMEMAEALVRLHHIQGPLPPLPLSVHPSGVDPEDAPQPAISEPTSQDPQTEIIYGLLILFSIHAEQIYCPQRHGQGCSLQHFV